MTAPLARPALVALAMALALLAPGCLQPSQGGDPAPSQSATPTATASPSAGTSAGPGPGPGPREPAPGTGTTVELLPDFELAPCVAVSVQSAQPLAAVQALLPEGFEAAPFGSDDTGMVALDAYACGNLTTPTAQVPDPVYGQAYTLVKRPVGVLAAAPEAGVHEYVFRVLAGRDVLASLWPAAGYPTVNGSANVSVSPPTDAPLDGGVRLGAASFGPEYGALAEGQRTLLPTASWSGTFARYTRLADGSVLLWTGSYDVPAAYSGPGLFSVGGDDPFAPFEAANNVPGLARMSESASMVDLDLRRVFP